MAQKAVKSIRRTRQSLALARGLDTIVSMTANAKYTNHPSCMGHPEVAYWHHLDLTERVAEKDSWRNEEMVF